MTVKMNWFKRQMLNAQFEKYCLFFINVYIFHIYGILTGSFGITLGQFGRILNLNTQELSLGLSAQAIFGCIASLIATYTLDRWNRTIQYGIDVFLLSIVIILFPFSNSLSEYLFYSGSIGFLTSVINCVNTIWVLELFRDNPSFFIQILFFFYPLGATFSRFLFSPFLTDSQLNATFYSKLDNDSFKDEQSDILIDAMSDSTDDMLNLKFTFFKSDIWIPFLIVGILMMLGSFMIFSVHFLNPFKKSTQTKKEEVFESNDDDLNKKESTKSKQNDLNQEEAQISIKKRSTRQQILSVVFVVLVCIIVTLQVGCEINFVNFVPTFLTRLSSFNFTETEASYISIVLTGCVTIGRFINIFLSLKIETEFMIYVNFILMLAGNLILVFLSGDSEELVWTGIGLVGLGFSSTYPLIIAFVEKRYLMTNSLSSLLEFSCLFFVCFSPIVFGHILDHMPSYFIYINTFTNMLLLILFSFLHFLGNFRKI